VVQKEALRFVSASFLWNLRSGSFPVHILARLR
jgi:hypothetical protein